MAERVNDDVRRFSSGFAAQWDSLYGGRRNLFCRAFDGVFRRDIFERYQLTCDELGPNLKGLSVLDIGCGRGAYCFEAARRGAAKVVGIDVAEDMIRLSLARRHRAPRGEVCQFVVSEFPHARSLPELSLPFDYAILIGVMDHVAEAEPFLAAVLPLVRRSAVLSFPGKHWLRAPLRQYRSRVLGHRAVHNYDESSIRRACFRAGFGAVEIKRLNHPGIGYFAVARRESPYLPKT